jgi:hypothetical protein
MSEVKSSKRQQPVRVFVSHSPMDNVFARKVRNLLIRQPNVRVFISEVLSAGGGWESKLRNELAAADVVIALLTPDSVDSSWVLHELGAAWALQKPIIPVVTRRDVLNRMPVPLEGAQVLELEDLESSETAERFVRAFEDSLAAAHIT